MNATGATKIEMKAVRLELAAEEQRDLRIEAAKEGKSMAALVRGLVKEFLAKRRGAAK